MKWKESLLKLNRNVLYGVTLIQIVMGALWVFFQFPHLQEWQSTFEYLEISENFVLDEYTGFLYPAFLRLFTEAQKWTGVPFYMPLYLLQLAAAVVTAGLFGKGVLKLQKEQAWWFAGYFVSFPLLLQFHLSIRPESLTLSGTMLLTWLFSKRSVIAAPFATMLLIWLMPENAVICTVMWTVYLFLQIKAGKGFCLRLAVFVTALLTGLFMNGLTQTPGSRGRIQKTFWAAAFQRVVTDDFSRSYAMWDDEVRTTFTIEEAMEQAKRTDNMMYSAGPMLEADWGKQRANELYRQMALDCLRVRTRDVVYRIRDDLLDSALMPYSLLWQGSGGRKSQTGWNYAKFRENSPGLSRFYIEYAGLASAVLLVTGIAAGFLVKSRRRRFLIFLPPAVTQCLLHVLKDGNAVDYGGLLMVTGFWCIMVFYSIIAARNGE